MPGPPVGASHYGDEYGQEVAAMLNASKSLTSNQLFKYFPCSRFWIQIYCLLTLKISPGNNRIVIHNIQTQNSIL